MRLIDQLRDGEFARIRGRVRRASHELVYAEGKRACVYWDLRKDSHAEPDEVEAQPFWVEDPHGDKVLVDPERIRILVAGEERKTLVETATADLHAVTARIRQIKDEFRESGSVDDKLRSERKRLAKIATLLCAIRAHARGNLHSSPNLHEQQRFIDGQMHLIQSDGLGTTTMMKMVDRIEVILVPDDPVVVEGVFRMEPMPPDLIGAQGYRERPTCWTVRDGSDKPAILVGAGAAAPRQNKNIPSEPEAPIADAQRKYPPPHQEPIVQGTAAAVIAAILYFLLFY